MLNKSEIVKYIWREVRGDGIHDSPDPVAVRLGVAVFGDNLRDDPSWCPC